MEIKLNGQWNRHTDPFLVADFTEANGQPCLGHTYRVLRDTNTNTVSVSQGMLFVPPRTLYQSQSQNILLKSHFIATVCYKFKSHAIWL